MKRSRRSWRAPGRRRHRPPNSRSTTPSTWPSTTRATSRRPCSTPRRRELDHGARHLARAPSCSASGKPDAALPILDRGLQGPQSAELWAYAATAWRMAGDPRSHWLEGDPALVGIIDLGDSIGDRRATWRTCCARSTWRGANISTSRCAAARRPTGRCSAGSSPKSASCARPSSTRSSDLSRALPPLDPGHPLLRHRARPADPLRRQLVGSAALGRPPFEPCPSARLDQLGALRLAARSAWRTSPTDSGWFTLGSPDERLGLDLPPWRKIEPKEGRLVLFPSWMWHGTVPFREGERLTVAFDVAPPR